MSIGPVLIFDKSTLQSLNPDEAVWLDHFFLSNITPLFYIETLSDLEKAVRAGKSPEQVVGEIAYKTPDMNSRPNMHHGALMWGELLGKVRIEMSGIPMLGGGQPVMLQGQTGMLYKQSPEEEAFGRWQRGEFLEVERGIAKQWRRELQALNLNEMKDSFKIIYESGGKPNTLDLIKYLADSVITGPQQAAILELGLELQGFDHEFRGQVRARWTAKGSHPIRDFAPYFAYVLSVDLFFYLAIAAGQIGSERQSNRADIAYLYYLPFCMVFTSKDKLHARCVPHFLRADQSFVNGEELKIDLRRLNDHFAALPDDIKDQGLYAFAKHPPLDSAGVVLTLWNKHLKPPSKDDVEAREPDKRPGLVFPPADDPEAVMRAISEMEESAVPISPEDALHLGQPSVVQFSRMILPKKGHWLRVPKDIFE
jgi:hypothetical protein